MKSVLSTIVLVTTIITASSGYKNICVRESDGATFKHPESDQLYYFCLHHETIEVNCRTNYYYSEQFGKCVLTSDSPGQNPTSFNPCENMPDITVIPSETDCQAFYFCIYGQPSPAVCPSGQLFDPIRLICDREENVDCNPWTTHTTTTLADETTTTTEIITSSETTTERQTTTTEEAITTETTSTEPELTEDHTTPSNLPTTNPESVCYRIPDTHLVNNPESCNSFFMCLFEIPIPGKCESPLIFNPYKHICDSPENVDCYDGTTIAPEICDGAPEGSLFNNPKSCLHFFICINNVAKAAKCPLGLFFNEIRKSCDPPGMVNCIPSTIPPDTTTNTPDITTFPTETPTSTATDTTTTEMPPRNYCAGVDDWVLLKNPRACDAFYMCLGGNAIPGTCPPETLFNRYLGICDKEENVDCDIGAETPTIETTTIETTTIESTTIETTTETTDICYGYADFTFLNDPRTCADYFICFIGFSIPRTCPDGLYFDPTISICARSETVDCDSNPITTTTDITTSSDETPTIESSTTTKETTIVTTTTTPEESSTTEEKSTTTEITTTDTTTTTEKPTTAQPPPVDCPSTGVVAIPDPQRCSRFRFCASGNGIDLTCPAGQHFVFPTEQCVPREIANCTIPIPTCDAAESGQNIIFLPHPQFCEKFFLCFNGSMTALECGPGEHFDIITSVCTSPAIAKCEG